MNRRKLLSKKAISYYSMKINYAHGFSLIELLIALALGMVVIAAAMGILIANRQTSSTTRALGQLQEHQQLAFSLLSADLRRAGDYPCAGFSKRTDHYGNDPLTYLVTKPHPDLNPHRDGLRGRSENNTDALDIYMHNASGADGYGQLANIAGFHMEVSRNNGGLGGSLRHDAPAMRDMEYAVICNHDVAMVFDGRNQQNRNCGSILSRQAPDYADCASTEISRRRYCFWPSNFNATPRVINHPEQFSVAVASECDEIGRSATFILDTQRMKVSWYVADNQRGDRSLYRENIEGQPEEIVSGVGDFQLRYHIHGETDYKTASAINENQWRHVDSVYIKIRFQTTTTEGLERGEGQGTDGQGLQRDMETYITLRNHVERVL